MEVQEGPRSRAKKLIRHPLKPEEFKNLVGVKNDPFFFSTFIKVIHPLRGRVSFNLYPFQKSVLWAFIVNRFNIILKFRQAGITELISMFCLWLAMYHPNKTIVIISIKDTVAKKVLRKMKFMYRNLPDYLKVEIVNGRPGELGTSSEIEFANGSLISSIPTTEEAGRSEALSLLVLDEAAIIRWADTIWASAFPTLSTGGRAILNSTPYGVGNFYHKTWVSACTNDSPFVPIRLKWQMHPERDEVWYNEMSAVLGPRRTAQEIDGDFLTSGNSVFDLVDIRLIEESLEEYEPLDIRKDSFFTQVFKEAETSLANLIIYSKPKVNRRYSIGADISSGRSRDYSAFSIMDDTGDEVGCFKGKLPPGTFANVLGSIGKKYNYATLAPESNDIGLATATKLQDMGYANLYYSEKLLKEKGQKKPKVEKIPGWYTHRKNRPLIIAELEEDMRLGNITIKNPYFTQEAYTFIYDTNNRPVAMGKDSEGSESQFVDDTYTDDAILAEAITNRIRKIRKKGPIILPA